MSEHVVPPRTYVGVFAALMVGTILTVVAAGQDFGVFNNAVALGIAVTKATLVVLFFMHVKYSSRLTWLVVASGFVWLVILLAITLSDYYSPLLTPGPLPTISRD
jgi:cytochrome c oxidase subunit 4